MSLDLKIELFGFHVFDDSFLERGIIETEPYILQIYRDECMKDNSFSEACDNAFIDAYYVRDLFFTALYTGEINSEEAKNWKSLSDLYDHVNRICNMEDLFGHLNIFEKMLATCTYVVNLCSSIHKDAVIDVVNYGHIVWAMYFDQFSEKFYKEGGWNELKKVSKTYKSLYKFLTYFEVDDFRFFKQASINYRRFKRNVKYQEGIKHISKLWIKFHVRNFDEYAIIQTWYETYADCYEIEILLQDLKLICNSSLELDTEKDKIQQESFQTHFNIADISNLKTIDVSEAFKTIDSECQRTTKSFETLLQGTSLTTSEKIAASVLVDMVENCKKAENGSLDRGIFSNKRCTDLDPHLRFRLNDLCSVIETNPKNVKETAEVDLNDQITSFAREKGRGTTNPMAVKQCDTFGASNFISAQRNRNDELDGSETFIQENLHKPTDLHYDDQVTENTNTKESLRISSDLKFSNKTVELCKEKIKLTDVSSTDQTSANPCKGIAIQKTRSSLKDSTTRIEIANESDGEIITNKGLNKLRKEQKDPEMRNFLRMILILGDVQGIQYVCGKFSNTDGDRDKSHAKLNKGKKKPQKKSIK